MFAASYFKRYRKKDLVKLKERGAIIRTRGGAILPSVNQEVPGYSEAG